jgi:hypothetical protein
MRSGVEHHLGPFLSSSPRRRHEHQSHRCPKRSLPHSNPSQPLLLRPLSARLFFCR